MERSKKVERMERAHLFPEKAGKGLAIISTKSTKSRKFLLLPKGAVNSFKI